MTSPFTGRRRSRPGAMLALALAVALPAPTAWATVTPVAAPRANPIAITTIVGKTVRIPDKKPTALFFFSVGCDSCVAGAISMGKAAAVVGNKAQFLIVDVDPSEKTGVIGDFLRSIGTPDLPAAIDQGAALSRTYRVSALSTLLVVNSKGKITYRATDPSSRQIQTALARAEAR